MICPNWPQMAGVSPVDSPQILQHGLPALLNNQTTVETRAPRNDSRVARYPYKYTLGLYSTGCFALKNAEDCCFEKKELQPFVH